MCFAKPQMEDRLERRRTHIRLAASARGGVTNEPRVDTTNPGRRGWKHSLRDALPSIVRTGAERAFRVRVGDAGQATAVAAGMTGMGAARVGRAAAVSCSVAASRRAKSEQPRAVHQ